MPAIFFLRWTVLWFFEDGSKYGYGLKSSLYVELLQCAFYPVQYPLNIGYHGKANRVRMVVLWARPWLGRIFNEFGGISIDLWAVLDLGCFLCSQGLARRNLGWDPIWNPDYFFTWVVLFLWCPYLRRLTVIHQGFFMIFCCYFYH